MHPPPYDASRNKLMGNFLYMEERCFFFVVYDWMTVMATKKSPTPPMHCNFGNICNTTTSHQDIDYNETMPYHLSHTCSNACFELQQCSLATLRADLSRYIAHLWNEEYNLLFGDDLSGGSIKKKIHPNLISKLFPLKTTIDILS